MALTGIYNSSEREIVLTPFQAQVFNQTIQYFKTTGVGGDSVFEDTYVLQKRVAEYIKQNVTTSGGSTSSFVNQIYNGVLGITPVAPPPPSGGSGTGSGNANANAGSGTGSGNANANAGSGTGSGNTSVFTLGSSTGNGSVNTAVFSEFANG